MIAYTLKTQQDQVLSSYCEDIVIISNIADLLTCRNYYQTTYVTSDEVNESKADLAYVQEEDPVLYSMLNDQGEIIVGNLFFRFLADGKVVIDPSVNPLEMANIADWSVDHTDLDYNIMMVGYAENPALIFDRGDSGAWESRDIVEPRFDVSDNNSQFILKNNSFVALLEEQPYAFRWLIDGEEVATTRDLTLAKKDYPGKNVRLQVLINDDTIGQTEDKEVELRTWFGDHAPVVIQIDDCEYQIRLGNLLGNSNLRFFFEDGSVVETDVYGAGGTTIVIQNPQCADGKFIFSLDIYNVNTGEIYCDLGSDDGNKA